MAQDPDTTVATTTSQPPVEPISSQELFERIKKRVKQLNASEGAHECTCNHRFYRDGVIEGLIAVAHTIDPEYTGKEPAGEQLEVAAERDALRAPATTMVASGGVGRVGGGGGAVDPGTVAIGIAGTGGVGAGGAVTPITGIPSVGVGGQAPPEPIMQFFAHTHLPEHLRKVSADFAMLAQVMVDTLPRNAERSAGLRKLLEAKDCAVRAMVAK